MNTLNAPLIGRAGEWAALDAALAAALEGQGGVVLLGGEPGVGKTRLAEEIAATAATRGARALWGRCYEGDGAPAFWPWVQILRALLRGHERPLSRADASRLAALIPELAPADAPAPPPRPESAEDRFHLFAAITALINGRSAGEPLVLLLDDIQWADVPSLLLLEFLARELGASRVLLVATFRDIEVAPEGPLAATLGRLARLPRVLRLDLKGLAADAVAALIAGITGGPVADARAQLIAGVTDGNPFFVGELARYGSAEPEQTRDGLAIPPSVRAVIGLRVGELSPACGSLLSLAAVIGREFPLRVLQQLSDGAGAPALDLIEEAETARIIVAGAAPGTFRFAHALLRETLYDATPRPRRVRLHLQVGEALEHLWGDDPDHLAALTQHFLSAAPMGDAGKALAYARRTARHARSTLAFEEAARYLKLALPLCAQAAPGDYGLRIDLLLELAAAHNAAGDSAAGQEAVLEAVALADAHGRPAGLVRAALTYEHKVDLGAVDRRWAALLERALRAVPEEHLRTRARLGATLARSLSFIDAERSAAAAGEALALARASGDPAVLAFALTYRLMSLVGPDEAGDRLPLATEIITLSQQTGDVTMQMQGHDRRALALAERGELAQADAEIAAMVRLGERQRAAHIGWRSPAWGAMRATIAGRFAEAEQLAAIARAEGERSGMPGAAQHFAIQFFALRRDQGRLAELVGVVAALAEQFPLPVWRAALTVLHVETGDLEAARGQFERLAAEEFRDVPADMLWLTTMALLAHACAALGDRERAALLYERLLPHRGRNVAVTLAVSASNGCISRELGLLAATMHRWREASALFAEAKAINQAMGARTLVARTRVDEARALFAQAVVQPAHAAELRARAMPLLAEAAAEAETLSMAGLATEIARLRGPELRESVAPAESAGLTARELDVLRLLAAGHTNKQIADALVLSVATVRGHTISIYGKIGASGRAAAAAFALRHGISPKTGG